MRTRMRKTPAEGMASSCTERSEAVREPRKESEEGSPRGAVSVTIIPLREKRPLRGQDFHVHWRHLWRGRRQLP